MLLTTCGSIKASANYSPAQVLSTYNFNFYYTGTTAFLAERTDSMHEDITVVKISNRGNAIIRRFVCSDSMIRRIKISLGYFDNIQRFIEATRGDPLLGCAEKYNGLRIRRLPHWNAAIVALAQQNNSFIPSWRSLARLIANYSDIQRLLGRDIYVLYDPARMLCKLTGYRGFFYGPDTCIKRYEMMDKLPLVKRDIEKQIKELREITGLGYRANTLLVLAYSFASGLVDTSSPDKFYYSLRQVKGFGHYSARLSTLLAYGRFRFPPLDRWTIRLASYAYGIPAKADSVEEEFMRRFGSDAGLAVFFLTVMLDADRFPIALSRVKEGKICPLKENGLSPLTLWKHDLVNGGKRK
ncbi:MAG: hypothetical protein F7B59_02710 [Desulfurococcales archaeon]|nr:hypothetical protein [Desulfurococcales archaeon]